MDMNTDPPADYFGDAFGKNPAPQKQKLKNLLLNGLLVLLPFVAAEGVFRLLPVSHPPHLQPVTAEQPIVRFQQNVDYLYSRDWNFSVKTHRHTNNFGYSNAFDYQPAATTPLMMVIGDSFVEGHVVNSGKTAAELLNTAVAGSGRVYSIGVSGSALSQYLAFAEYSRNTFHPQAMAFVIISNDFDESLLKYKQEPRLHYFDADGKLQRVDYAMPAWKRVLRHSAFIRYVMLNLESEYKIDLIRKRLAGNGEPKVFTGQELEQRVADSHKAVDFFLDQLPAKSGLGAESIVFVLDALRPAIYSDDALRQVDNLYNARMRRYFAQQAGARGYQVVDMQPVFIRRHQQDHARFEAAPNDSHWNELAHRLAADELRKAKVFTRVFGGNRQFAGRTENAAEHPGDRPG
jgi:hypothetical protein